MTGDIKEQKAIVSEVMIPAKVTGWIAFVRGVGGPWQTVTSVKHESDPVLPFYAYRTREEAIIAAQGSCFQPKSVKLVAVEFEVYA